MVATAYQGPQVSNAPKRVRKCQPTFLEGVEAGDTARLLDTEDMTCIDVGQVRECVDRGKGAEEIFKR